MGELNMKCEQLSSQHKQCYILLNLVLNLWAEAINSAIYISNRSGPSTAANKISYELWFGKSPKFIIFKNMDHSFLFTFQIKKDKIWMQRLLNVFLLGTTLTRKNFVFRTLFGIPIAENIGINYCETFNSMVKFTTIRTIYWQKPVYMSQSTGYNDSSGRVTMT